MLSTSIHFDFSTFEREIRNIRQEKLPSVIRNALNDTAREARKIVQDEMDRVFDRPTPYAKRGVVYDKASKERLQAAVVVTGDRTRGGLPATAFLGPQIQGGLRTHKAFERQLIQRGVMINTEVAIPAARTPLDRYGNITQGFLNRLMADLQIDYRGAGATRTRTDRSKKRNQNYRSARFFVPRRGSDHAPGIWQTDPRSGETFPVVLFVRSRPYRVRLQLKAVVERHARANIYRNFERAFVQVMGSSR